MPANGLTLQLLRTAAFLAVGGMVAAAWAADRRTDLPDAVELSTYLGGPKTETPCALALSSAGEVLIAGSAPARVIGTMAFPVPAQMESLLVGGSLTIYSPATRSVSTPVVLGSSLTDTIRGMAVDRSGNIFVAGTTVVSDLAVHSPAQPQYGGGLSDAFVAKLTPDGQGIIWLTYLGGSGAEEAWGLDVDSTGNVYVTGFTSSADFPLKNVGDRPAIGSQKAFLVKYSTTGEMLLSTVFGGTVSESPKGVKLDAGGNIYVFGATASPDFPVHNAVQSTCASASCGFLTKLAPDAQTVVYSTYLSLNGTTTPRAAAIDATGAIYLVGETSSTTQNEDGFLLKLPPAGDSFVFSITLGGTGADGITGVAVGDTGDIHIAGYTGSADFPALSGLRGGTDMFYMTLAPGAQSITRTLVFGGAGDDIPQGIVIDRDGALWISGYTKSEDFPVKYAPQQSYGGAGDLFLVRVAVQ